MSLTLKDRCKQKIAANAGTGSITLSTSIKGFKTISSALSNGDTSYFCLESANGDWEVFSGTYTASGTTISRDTVLASSNSGNKIDIGTSITFCYIVYPADKATYKDGSGRIVSGAAGIIFSDASVQTTAATTPDLSPYLTIVAAAAAYQPLDSDLTAIAGLSTAVYGRSLLTLVDEAAARTSLSVYSITSTDSALALKAPLASPTFTGTPAAPTAAGGTNTTQIATTAFVTSAVGGIDLSPYLTSTTAASTYLPLAGGTLTGLTTVAYSNSGTTLGGASGIPSQGISLINTNGGTSGNPFGILFGGTTGYHHSAIFGVQLYDTGNRSGDLVFATRQSTADSSLTEAVRMTFSGWLEVGRPQSGMKGSHIFNARTLASQSNLGLAGNLVIQGEGSVAQDAGAGLCLAGPWSGTSWTTACGIKAAKTNATDGAYGFDMTFHTRVNGGSNTEKMRIFSDGSLTFINNTLDLRNSTNAQTFRLAETYTSSTSFGALQIKANAGAAYQIGSTIGSAGGTNRDLSFGHWNSGGAFSTLLNVSGASGGSTVRIATTSGAGTCGLEFGSTLSGWQMGQVQAVYDGLGGWGTGINFVTNRGAGPGDLVTPFAISSHGNIAITQIARTTASPTAFTLTGAAHTTLTASTEATDVNFNLARTVQFATGAINTQRAMRIQAPTYSFVGVSTITTASTLSISGPPVAGTLATITNPYALNVESGNVKFAGAIVADGVAWTGKTYYQTGYSSVGWGLSAGNWYWGYGSTEWKFGLHATEGVQIFSGSLGFNGQLAGSPSDLLIYRDAAGVLHQRNGTNAQTLRVAGTWTSSTSYETLNIKGKASANFEIGPENGSAGGTLRGLTLGGYSAGSATITPWLAFSNAGVASFYAQTGTMTVGDKIHSGNLCGVLSSRIDTSRYNCILHGYHDTIISTGNSSHTFRTSILVSGTDHSATFTGAIKPPTLTDAAAPNNSIYFSSDANKLVYKDAGGTINNLY